MSSGSQWLPGVCALGSGAEEACLGAGPVGSSCSGRLSDRPGKQRPDPELRSLGSSCWDISGFPLERFGEMNWVGGSR